MSFSNRSPIPLILVICCILLSTDGRLSFDAWMKPTKNSHDLNPNKLSPVIFVPGVGGNILEAALNKPSAVHYVCWKNSDWFDIWLDPDQMVPWLIDCWVDNMRLSYDNSTRTTRNSPGVKLRVPGWGRTFTMDKVDKSIIGEYDYGYYFYYIITALTNNGYNSTKNLYGAPYDFRKGPNENAYWFPKLKNLVEKAFDENEEQPVTFISHSMGGRMLLYFLQQMTQEWKDKYVSEMITLSAPWGGSIQALQAILIGYDFGSSLIQNAAMKAVQESCPSVVWLMPSEYFWKPNEVLISTKSKNYTVENVEDFFYDINNPNIVEMKKDLAKFNNFSGPGVDVHCLYGRNFNGTVERLDFGSGYNPKPALTYGNGDGTVNERSLLGCGHWRNTVAQNKHQVHEQAFPNAEHYNMLSDNRVINYILNRLTGIENYLDENEQKDLSNLMKFRIF